MKQINTIPTDTLRLTHLLQLASPALPVGGYSYSQGLEWAVESGQVRDRSSAARWISGVLHGNFANFETPLLVRLLRCWLASDREGLAHWNGVYLAARESAELRAETVQMGYSLKGLLLQLGILPERMALELRALEPASYPAAWSAACAGWDIAEDSALTAHAWSWLENQVLAALKLVPLGQVAGQELLLELGATIPRVVGAARTQGDDELSNFAPGLAIASSRHETQYSRLFRS
jgi:urease accessory protein